MLSEDIEAMRHALQQTWVQAASGAERARRDAVVEAWSPQADSSTEAPNPPTEHAASLLDPHRGSTPSDSPPNINAAAFMRLVGMTNVQMGEILNSTPSCYKIVDSQGRLLFMNRRGISLIEAPNLDAVLGADVYSLVVPEHRDAFVAFNERVCAGATESLEFEIIGLGGTRRHMESWAATYELSNGEKAHVAVTNDVSDRVQAARTLDRQRDALAQAQRLAAVGEFAAGIAHEINNPIGIIKGLAGTLRHQLDLPDQDVSEFRDDLLAIEETVDRVARLVQGLKIFARDGDLIVREHADLAETIHQTIELCTPKLKDAGVHISADLEGDLSMTTNPTQVGQVLMNLVSNASHAIADLEDKAITIKATSLPNQAVQIEVRDSGRLTDAHVIANMMTPFFTTNSAGDGTGLGLSISHGLVQALGGRLYFDPSRPNTTFVVELPKGQH